MGGYIGATAVGLTTTAADVQGDITSTDTTPELVLKNTSEEDSDGGREGKVTFKGEQTGGEESTLAQIEGRHEGTADDEKGELLFKTNDGSDGSSPTTALTINSEQKIGIGTTAPDNKLHVFESSTTQTASTESQLVLEKNSDSGITILSGQTSNGRILFGDSGDNDIGQIDYDHNNNSMSIVTNATEALKIDSSQNIGINQTTPTAQLHIKNASTNNLNQFLVESTNDGTASGPDLATYRNSASPADSDTLGALWFYGNNSAAEQTLYAGILGQADDVTDATEDASIYFFGQTGGTPETWVRINGNGISPSGEATSANFLGDVEEGTWTPTAGTIYAGPANSSSFTSSGTYKKIDNRVLIEYVIDFNLTSSSTATGDRFAITGLPFGFAGSFVGGGQGFQYGAIGTGNNAIWHNFFHSSTPDYIGFYCHYEDGTVAYNRVIKGNAWYLTS